MKNQKLASQFFLTKWVVWLFPALALIATGTLFYEYLLHRGPLIQIRFTEAPGLEPEKTGLRYRGVLVGRVESVALAENGKGVVVFARLDREAKDLAVEGTQFSIVQPQVDFQGVRGLETIFRGPYIRISQGKGAPTEEFLGRIEGDGDESSKAFVNYYLQAPFVNSIRVGDSLFYRGMKIGTLISMGLSATGQRVDMQIQIEKKYVRVIRTNTVFWQKTAVEAKLGLFGSKVKIGSLESLLKGGINLSTPNNPGKIADAESHFDLLTSPPNEVEKWSPRL
ncbi:MAG: pqiB [Bacteriovoracaceae bacterium]|nr:pqiB [Bacteriovoracaceae bacterium]